MNKSIAIILFIFFISIKLYCQELQTITGECIIKEPGTLYIFLVDENEFKKQLSGIKTITLTIEDNINEHKIIPFEFKIKKGIYGIRCYLDKNKNQKLDGGIFGPKEPWGMSWTGVKKTKIPKFKNISFTLEGSIILQRIEVIR